MADQNINVRIKHKYDTESNWSSKNPVLLKGEIAFSSDKNGQFKIGDGINKWSALNYNSVPWSGVTGKPSTFTPSSHTHDDRYYTESEVDSKLSGKSNTTHNHDDRYYTESEMDTKLSGKSNINHSHDLNTMINTLGTADSTPTDEDYYVSQYVGGGTTNTTYFRRPLSALWSYIKSKADSIYQAKGNYASSNHNHTISNITNIGSASVNYANSAGSASRATTATNVSATEGTADVARHVWFSDGGAETQRCYTDSLKYNPVSNSMTVNITGSSASATTASSCSGNAATATNASKVNNHTVNSDVPSNAKFTDTIYTHPSYTAKSSGLYKVTVDGTGHVSAATAVTKADITGLGIPGSDTNTWRPLGTTGDTACAGNDSRLSNARPASDVSAWAKASSKPSYTKSEVGLGNVDNTADSQKSVKYATSAGSASSASSATTAGTCTGNSATATSVVDYGNTSAKINIGYAGSGISGDAIKYLAGYTTGTNGATTNIKDVSKDALKSWLGLGSLAYSSATIPTIPSSLPANGGNASTVNGHTVNADVPAGAKFTDTDTWRGIQDNLTSTSTSDSLSANQGRVLKGLIDVKSNSGHTHSTATINTSGFMSSTDKIKLNTLTSEMDDYFTQGEINTIFA